MQWSTVASTCDGKDSSKGRVNELRGSIKMLPGIKKTTNKKKNWHEDI